MTPKIEILQTFHFFGFNEIYVDFRKMFWIRMLKRFDKTRTRCTVVVYKEINAVFWKEKDLKMTTTKNSRFLTFLCNFCQIFEKLRGLECRKRSTWY